MTPLPKDEFDEVFEGEQPVERTQIAPVQETTPLSEVPSELSTPETTPVTPSTPASTTPPPTGTPVNEVPVSTELLGTSPVAPPGEMPVVTAPQAEYYSEPIVPELPGSASLPETPSPDVLSSILEQVKNDPELRSYIDEYPEIAGPQMKLLARTLEKVVGVVANEIEKRDSLWSQSLSPILNDYQQKQEAAHYDKILSAHPEAAEWVSNGAVEGWIKQQPRFVQDALMKVYIQGGADDVIELLNQFKASQVPINPPTQQQEQVMMQEAQQHAQLEKEQGRQLPPQTQPQPVQAGPKELPAETQGQAPELSPDDQQRLAMIEAVKRKGATEPKTSKAVDFDSAFEEAIRGLM